MADYHVTPSICVNEEALETDAVLAGHVIGQVTAISAAEHIRAGRLLPLLTEHVVESASAFVYYGSRAAKPVRVSAFIDLTLARLATNPKYLLSAEELGSRLKQAC